MKDNFFRQFFTLERSWTEAVCNRHLQREIVTWISSDWDAAHLIFPSVDSNITKPKSKFLFSGQKTSAVSPDMAWILQWNIPLRTLAFYLSESRITRRENLIVLENGTAALSTAQIKGSMSVVLVCLLFNLESPSPGWCLSEAGDDNSHIFRPKSCNCLHLDIRLAWPHCGTHAIASTNPVGKTAAVFVSIPVSGVSLINILQKYTLISRLQFAWRGDGLL